MPRTENVGEGEREVEEDDLATAFYDDDQIDLTHLIMEQFQLALPMKALCAEACKGLCPQCGTNLNTGSCNCNVKWEDPRLARAESDEARPKTYKLYYSSIHFYVEDSDHAESQTAALEIAHVQAAHPRHAGGDAVERLPELPRAEAAPPRVPALRVLSRPAGARQSTRRNSLRMIRIAVDAMGGDHAPRSIIDGALAAARHLDLGLLLAGPADAIRAELARHPDAAQFSIRILDAPDVIGMAEAPAAALRRKPRASIRVAADAVANGEASALVSAGHTGATVLSAHGAFGMLPGVDRPALAATIPSGDRLGILLDVGANVECRAAHLLQFGAMGAVYAQDLARHRSPAYRAAVDRRGREQGDRVDSRSAPAAQRRRRSTSSATSRRAKCTRATPT